ncbi:flagellar hook-length control protein [Enterobacter cancerogenus]|uniref:Flagellar hook-length control protein n=1 Tax=Enterobacter cancerogenus TaxID=69218 RepID=A0A484YFK9_9ENTR|nr:flagellar hook-length control protein [Enterobacter cancerogenus]
MITLQQLLMTDSDLSGGTQTGKGTEGAQDFLSLLAGALTETGGQGKRCAANPGRPESRRQHAVESRGERG